MKVELTLPPSRPGPFVLAVTAINFKATGTARAQLPPNSRAIVDKVRVIHEDAASLSNGANVRVREWDANSPEAAVAAAGESSFAVAEAEIDLVAKTPGAAGNGITLDLVDPEANDAALAVAVDGLAITVDLATNGSGEITTTAAQLKAAIEASAAAAALIGVSFTTGNDGTGVVTAAALTLTGGKDRFEGEAVQDIVAAVDTTDTVATGTIQALTVSTSQKVSRDGPVIEVAVLGAATATRDSGTILVEGTLL